MNVFELLIFLSINALLLFLGGWLYRYVGGWGWLVTLPLVPVWAMLIFGTLRELFAEARKLALRVLSRKG